MKWCWILSHAFFLSIEDDASVPYTTNMVLHWCLHAEPALHSCGLPLSRRTYPFSYVVGSLSSILLRISAPRSLRMEYRSVVFPQCLWVALASGWHWPHKRNWETFLPLPFFGRVCQVSVLILLQTFNIHHWSHLSGLGLFFTQIFSNLCKCYRPIQSSFFNVQNSNFIWFNSTHFSFYTFYICAPCPILHKEERSWIFLINLKQLFMVHICSF